MHEQIFRFVMKPYYIQVLKKLNQLVPGEANEEEAIRVLQSVHGSIKIVLNLFSGEIMHDQNKEEFDKNIKPQVL